MKIKKDNIHLTNYKIEETALKNSLSCGFMDLEGKFSILSISTQSNKTFRFCQLALCLDHLVE